MRYRSLPGGINRIGLDLRFGLTVAGVARIEEARRSTSPGGPFLHITFEARVAWLEQTHGQPSDPPGSDPFQTMLGLHSALNFFWTTSIDAISVGVDPSVWIANVVPGLGVDRVRLVEIHLLPALPTGLASARWDDAQRAFQNQKYDECIGHCGALSGHGTRSSTLRKSRRP